MDEKLYLKRQSRKFLVTINNPELKGETHETIIDKAQSLSSFRYMCIADEVGAKEHTPHTHAFIAYDNPKTFKTIKNLYPEAHIDVCRGSCLQNRNYVFKEGKFENSEKGTTALRHTQKEVGEIPPERLCPKPELELLFELIKEGKRDIQILEEYPEYCLNLSDIQRIRTTIIQAYYEDTNRDVDVTYIYGLTGAGKSRYVMDTYGASNVYRVTDYTHPFDGYQSQDVLVLDEYASSFTIQNLLNYLDIYPLTLPCRYSNRVACYTKVFIISNLNPWEQYPNAKDKTPEVYRAFQRRINRYMHFYAIGEYFIYESFDDTRYPLAIEQCRALRASGITTLPAGERKPYVPYKTVPIYEAQASDEEVQKLLRGFWDDGKNSK